MTPDKLAVAAADAVPEQLDYLERRAARSTMSDVDRAAVKRAIADRRAQFKSPEWLAKVARA